MERCKLIFLITFLSGIVCFAQNPSCNNNFIYLDGAAFIKVYNPNLPLSATNPSPTNIPSFGAGLALMPNINGGTLSPTFYSTSAGTYWYWSGTGWINTGHAVGSSIAVNLAGCAGTIYNFVGSSGQVYSYNGNGPGSLLTTIPGFNGGGPYDLVTDCNCNFYSLKTSTPNQQLSMYSASGALQCTYSLTGVPNASAGGGFAIVGNKIYLHNGNFYIGTIGNGVVTFTNVTGFNSSPGDFASCPVCYAPNDLNGASITSGLITCTIPTINLIATTTISPVTYSWTGPGIIGATNASFVTVNATGTYSCLLMSSSCPAAQTTLTTTVLSNSVNVLASITPSGNICVQNNASTHLVVSHSFTNDVISWSGPGFSASAIDSIDVTQTGSYTVSVTDLFSGCIAKDVVNIAQTPTVTLALSDNTLCLESYNGSPASITITPSGATNYTLLTSSNFSTTSPNGPTMPGFATTIAGNLSPFVTATLIGNNGGCGDTASTYFIIVPNPVISLSEASASICPGQSEGISVSGANQYVWGGNSGLDTYSGSAVIASPSVSSIYSVVGSSLGCNSLTQSVSVIVLPIPLVSISPATSTVCLGTVVTLTANGTADTFNWSPSIGLLSFPGSSVVGVNPSSSMTYSVLGSLNSCTNSASATVTIVQPPVLSLSLSSPTLCADNFNNSPNSINLTPSGALNYTLIADNGAFVSSPNGPVMHATPSGLSPGSPVITATLTGETSVCKVSITKSFTIIPNPVLSISPSSASICPKQNQAFFVSGASTYTWLPMSHYTLTANNSILANPVLTSFYSVAGSSNGCNSDLKNAVLVLLPVPDVTLSPKTSTVCEGNSVVLNALGNGSSYNWFPPASLSSSFGSQVIATPLTFQNYTVTAILNTCTNQAVASVSVIEIPDIHITTSQSVVCSSSSTQLNVTGANSFLWFPPANLSSPSGNAVWATQQESTTYTVHGYNGVCTGSTSIYIKTIKRPDMDLTSTSSRVCTGSFASLSATGAQSYVWSPVNSLFSPSTKSTVVAGPLQTTNYTVVGSNSDGSVSCSQQLNYMVTVVPVIIPIVSSNVTLCEGEPTTLYAKGGNTFSWTPSYGLNITNASGVVARPKVTTVYTVEVSDNNYCGNTTTVMVSVNPKPQVYAGRDTSYNLNEAIFIEAKGTGTLTWVRGEDIICAVCPLTQIYPTRDGCYFVEAVNDYGCKVSDDVCVKITEDFTAYIPNSFSPNNDGLNEQFLIFGENISQVSMEIYDRWGMKIFYSEDFNVGWDGRFKSEICPVGVYTYVIRYTGLNRKKYIKTGSVSLIK